MSIAVCSLLILLNVIFGLLYCGLINSDLAFREWKRQRRSNKCMAGVIVTMGVVLNYKAMRLFYSKFWGITQCLASFHEFRRVFTLPLLLLTFIGMAGISVPIIIIDIYAFFHYFSWGSSQLPIVLIETLVIELALVAFLNAEAVNVNKVPDLIEDTLSDKPYDKIKPGSFTRLRAEENSFSSFL